MALPLRQSDDLAAYALADLAEDIDELQHLAGSQLRRLHTARLEINRKRRGFRPRTLRTELAQLLSAENTFRSYEQALGTCLYDISRGVACVDDLRAIKNEYVDHRTATEIGLGPFVRISPGTEDLLELDRLKEVFSDGTRELSAVNR